MRYVVALLSGMALTTATHAEVALKPVEYKHGGVVLEGCVAADPALPPGKRPGVLLVHGSGGNSQTTRQRAFQFARLGYTVFAADIFGKGISPRDTKDAIAKAGLGASDRTAIRARLQIALDLLAKQPNVDAKLISGVGYGAGGTALMELARSGADMEGIACVHSPVPPPSPEDAKKISASILVIVGADDPFVPLAQLSAMEQVMTAGGVDWQTVRMGGVAHDFTNPAAGRNLKSGAAYDPDADARAQGQIRLFLAEMFPARPATAVAKAPEKTGIALPKGVPEKVAKVLKHVDDEGEAISGYEGGRTFGNFERRLPQSDKTGKRIRYREWDVNPLRPGVNRGAERLVTGSDGSAYYTSDHYNTFTKIR